MKELEQLRQIKSSVISTIADGKPHARMIDIMLVEDDKIYFTTARGKHFYNQLLKTPYVAITAMDIHYVSIRISGTVKQVDRSYIDKIFAANPMMNDIYPGEKRDILEPFCVEKGVGEIFDISKMPITRSRFAFGGEALIPLGYTITDQCIACGMCLDACPEGAIEAGAKYGVKSERCIECGRCEEVCPASAIKRPEAL